MKPFDTLSGEMFDIREAIDRWEALNTQLESGDPPLDEDENDELTRIQTFLDDVRGNGGDHQWKGEWYPCGFVAEYYFKEYAMDLAEDIGAINHEASWPNTCIDWNQAVREL